MFGARVGQVGKSHYRGVKMSEGSQRGQGGGEQCCVTLVGTVGSGSESCLCLLSFLTAGDSHPGCKVGMLSALFPMGRWGRGLRYLPPLRL